ncbi:hypothetical protein F5Y19DRAFT_422663 [Xylariaceae sp. FL1651]|nr:hypothetical protein F5Y19DRAFT_422663 [Xylariaceae sp. FL1651]
MSSTQEKPISIGAFLSNFVFGLLIQDDQDISDIVFKRYVSPSLSDRANGTPLQYKTFEDFVNILRQEISDRRLLSESSVAVPDDDTGVTGTASHIFQFSGIEDGQRVKGTVVSVVGVGLVDDKR